MKLNMDKELYEISKKEKTFIFYEVLKAKYPELAKHISSKENKYASRLYDSCKIILENIIWAYDPVEKTIINEYSSLKHYNFLPHKASDTELYGRAYAIYLIIEKDDIFNINMEYFRQNDWESDCVERFTFLRKKELKEGDTFFVGSSQTHRISVPELNFTTNRKDLKKRFFWCLAIFIKL